MRAVLIVAVTVSAACSSPDDLLIGTWRAPYTKPELTGEEVRTFGSNHIENYRDVYVDSVIDCTKTVIAENWQWKTTDGKLVESPGTIVSTVTDCADPQNNDGPRSPPVLLPKETPYTVDKNTLMLGSAVFTRQ